MDVDEHHEGRDFRKLFSKEIWIGEEIRIRRLRGIHSVHGGMHGNVGIKW